MFLDIYFGQDMIIYIVNDTEKIGIFVVRPRLFACLNDPYVLNGLCVNDTSLEAIASNLAFC